MSATSERVWAPVKFLVALGRSHQGSVQGLHVDLEQSLPPERLPTPSTLASWGGNGSRGPTPDLLPTVLDALGAELEEVTDLPRGRPPHA